MYEIMYAFKHVLCYFLNRFRDYFEGGIARWVEIGGSHIIVCNMNQINYWIRAY